MAKAYSLDLRKKVLSFISKGHTYQDTSSVFGVSHMSIYRWIKLNKEGILSPQTTRDRAPLKLDPVDVKQYVQSHPDHTLKQIAKHFNVGTTSIFYRLKQLGFSYKKKVYIQGK